MLMSIDTLRSAARSPATSNTKKKHPSRPKYIVMIVGTMILRKTIEGSRLTLKVMSHLPLSTEPSSPFG